MIVARGLGRPGNLLVSGGLGKIFYQAFDGTTYVFTSTGWQLVTQFWVHNGASWVNVPDMHINKSGNWTQVW